jgi:hypothetical protein
MLIATGLPQRGRGYVLRRILRRESGTATRLGLTRPFRNWRRPSSVRRRLFRSGAVAGVSKMVAQALGREGASADALGGRRPRRRAIEQLRREARGALQRRRSSASPAPTSRWKYQEIMRTRASRSIAIRSTRCSTQRLRSSSPKMTLSRRGGWFSNLPSGEALGVHGYGVDYRHLTGAHVVGLWGRQAGAGGSPRRPACGADGRSSIPGGGQVADEEPGLGGRTGRRTGSQKPFRA